MGRRQIEVTRDNPEQSPFFADFFGLHLRTALSGHQDYEKKNVSQLTPEGDCIQAARRRRVSVSTARPKAPRQAVGSGTAIASYERPMFAVRDGSPVMMSA